MRVSSRARGDRARRLLRRGRRAYIRRRRRARRHHQGRADPHQHRRASLLPRVQDRRHRAVDRQGRFRPPRSGRHPVHALVRLRQARARTRPGRRGRTFDERVVVILLLLLRLLIIIIIIIIIPGTILLARHAAMGDRARRGVERRARGPRQALHADRSRVARAAPPRRPSRVPRRRRRDDGRVLARGGPAPRVAPPTASLCCAGHSLGGSMATLLMAWSALRLGVDPRGWNPRERSDRRPCWRRTDGPRASRARGEAPSASPGRPRGAGIGSGKS